EQQTATAEVLQVINSSPGDLGPVFDAMLEKAMRLCHAAHGHFWRIEGQRANAVALHGDLDFVETMRRRGPTGWAPGSGLARVAAGEQIVYTPDCTQEEAYRTQPAFREFINATKIRTSVMVALRKDQALLGAIVVHRKEVRPFTNKQIALLQNFAAQAVIAMENAGLITEAGGGPKQQTATAEVLGVINSSPGDLNPVFDAMLEKAMDVCGAAFGTLFTYDGQHFIVAALRGVPALFAKYLRRMTA